jgi:hypothetical protein
MAAVPGRFSRQHGRQKRDDSEACRAAHYVERHQESLEKFLAGIRSRSIRANARDNERMQGFYPSLCVIFGERLRKIGSLKQAQVAEG